MSGDGGGEGRSRHLKEDVAGGHVTKTCDSFIVSRDGVEVVSLLTFLDEFPSAPHKPGQLVLRTERERQRGKYQRKQLPQQVAKENVHARQDDSIFQDRRGSRKCVTVFVRHSTARGKDEYEQAFIGGQKQTWKTQ